MRLPVAWIDADACFVFAPGGFQVAREGERGTQVETVAGTLRHQFRGTPEYFDRLGVRVGLGIHHAQRIQAQRIAGRQRHRTVRCFHRFPQGTAGCQRTRQLGVVIGAVGIDRHSPPQVVYGRLQLLQLQRSHARHEMHAGMLRDLHQERVRQTPCLRPTASIQCFYGLGIQLGWFRHFRFASSTIVAWAVTFRPGRRPNRYAPHGSLGRAASPLRHRSPADAMHPLPPGYRPCRIR